MGVPMQSALLAQHSLCAPSIRYPPVGPVALCTPGRLTITAVAGNAAVPVLEGAAAPHDG